MYIIAVSGGVDSVVLLDVIARTGRPLIVAHFDHGIRETSAADARFVKELAVRYGATFEMRREELGAGVSEELARERRYLFLLETARRHGGVIVTAHHQDDIVETVAMNLRRGTRWRGLSVMSDARLVRPLHGWSKRQILRYASSRRLEWIEDETNALDIYTRNRFRRKLNQQLSEQRRQRVYRLWKMQRALRGEIEDELSKFDDRISDRYFLTNIDKTVAFDLLYSYVLRRTGVSLMTRQLESMLIAIKTGRAGTTWQLGSRIVMKLTNRSVIINRVV